MSNLSSHRHAVSDENLVRWFLRQGADPNASSEACDITPFSCAVQKATFEVIQLLFQKGGSTAQGQLLNMASDRTDPDSVAILQFLFDRGDTRINDTYLDSRPELNLRGCVKNAAPLHHAARVGNINTVRWLLQHGANPWQRTVVTIGYGTTPIDSACYDGHTDIVDVLLEAIKEFPDPPEQILPKAPTGNKIVDSANKDYYESTIQGVRRDINHGNGDRQRGVGVMDYSFELMILTLMEKEWDKKTHKKSSEGSDHSDRCDTESQADSPDELPVSRMIKEHQDKKNQLMKCHEQFISQEVGKNGGSRFNFEEYFDNEANEANRAVGPLRSTITFPSTDASDQTMSSNQKQPPKQSGRPSTRLSSLFWATLGWK